MLIIPNAFEYQEGPDEVFGPYWIDVKPDGRIKYPDFALNTAMFDFWGTVRRIAGLGWTTGTIFGVRSHEATTPGEWHSDTGAGTRFVGAASLVVPAPGQEFEDYAQTIPESMASGSLAVYTKERHRRPATPPGGRIFFSATLYRAGEDVDLSCARLEPLR